MDIEFAENFSSVQEMLIVEDPVVISLDFPFYPGERKEGKKARTYFFPLYASNGKFRIMASQYPLITNKKVRKA